MRVCVITQPTTVVLWREAFTIQREVRGNKFVATPQQRNKPNNTTNPTQQSTTTNNDNLA